MLLLGSSQLARCTAPSRDVFAQDGPLARMQAVGCSLHVLLFDTEGPFEADGGQSAGRGAGGLRPVLASQSWLADAVLAVGGSLRVFRWDGSTRVMRHTGYIPRLPSSAELFHANRGEDPFAARVSAGSWLGSRPRSRPGTGGAARVTCSSPDGEGAALDGLLTDALSSACAAQSSSA